MRRFGAHRVATFALASLCFIQTAQTVQTVQAQTAAQGRSLLSFEPAATAQAQTAGGSDRGLPTFFPEDVPRRRVRVDIDLLRQGAPRLDLLTPDGRTLQARLTHFEERGGGDVLWSGRVPGASYDTISLTVHNGHVHGSYGAPGEAKHALRAGGDGLGAVASEAEAGGGLEPNGHAWCEETIAPFPEGPEAVLEAFAARAAAEAAAAESLSQAEARPRAASASTAPAPERLALAQTAVPVALSVSPLSVAEDAAAPVTVTVTATVAAGDTSGSDRTIMIEVGDAPAMEGVATPGVDFTNVSGFSLNLLANQTSGTASFTLAPVNDASPEPHETVRVSGTLAGATVTPAEVEITDDDQHVIDIAILYTPSTASIMAGVTRDDPTVTIASDTQGAVDYVNLIWRNNAFPARLNLVHVAAVPQGVMDNRGYGPRDYIFAMREDPDLLRLREAHDADLVFLWTWERTTNRLPCGVAFLRSKTHTTETMAPSGVGVYNFVCDPGATPWSILAHEIGHVLGALHDPANHSPDPRVPIYPYAFGHTHLSGGNELNVATIMSYGTPRRCIRFGFFGCRQYGNTFTREPFYSTARVQPTRRADPDANTANPLSGPVPVGILNERENERAIRHLLHSTSTFDRHMLAAPPANLTGTASASGATVNVALTWDDVSSRETGYAVQYRVFGDGPWQTGANLASNVEGTTLTGLNPGTRYVFRVAATNSLGFVSHSYEWVVRTPGIAPPNAPGNLRVEVVRRSVGRRDIAGTVNLTWSDWSESETGFLVQYREVGAVDWTAGPTVAADGTSVEVTDLGNDVEYEFRVGAVNAHGTAWSRIVTARTEPPVAPDAPGDLVGLRLSSTTVRLSWLDNSEDLGNEEVNETAFDIHVRPFAGQEWTVVASAPPDTETTVVGGLPENSHLTFRVASVGPGGQGLSDEVSIDLTVEPPGMPVVRSWLDRDASDRIVPRFEITVEPSNGAEFYMATRSVGVWTRYTTRELTGATPFRAEARNGGGRRVSEDFFLGPTPVPPRRPSGLSATQAGPTSVRFSWTDNATDELWYRVSLGRGGAPAVVYGVYPAGTSEVTLVGLRPGSYELELDTANAAGAISPSTTTFTLPVPDPLPPNPATNLAAAFGSATTEVDLTWTDNSSDETGFRVGVRAEDGAWTFADVAAGTTSHTATGLTPNTLYDFRILAVSAAGSFESDLVSFDLHPAPRAPSELRARVTGSTSAVLDWLDNASNETSFRVESRQGAAAWGAAVSNLPANTRTWTATGLSPGASYDFRVVAINNAGESTSGDASLTMSPAAPTNLQASVAGATSASLTWTDNASTETSFQVEYRGKSESGWTLWAPDPAADATTVTVTGLVPNRDYEFRVFARARGPRALVPVQRRVRRELPAALRTGLERRRDLPRLGFLPGPVDGQRVRRDGLCRGVPAVRQGRLGVRGHDRGGHDDRHADRAPAEPHLPLPRPGRQRERVAAELPGRGHVAAGGALRPHPGTAAADREPGRSGLAEQCDRPDRLESREPGRRRYVDQSRSRHARTIGEHRQPHAAGAQRVPDPGGQRERRFESKQRRGLHDSRPARGAFGPDRPGLGIDRRPSRLDRRVGRRGRLRRGVPGAGSGRLDSGRFRRRGRHVDRRDRTCRQHRVRLPGQRQERVGGDGERHGVPHDAAGGAERSCGDPADGDQRRADLDGQLLRRDRLQGAVERRQRLDGSAGSRSRRDVGHGQRPDLRHKLRVPRAGDERKRRLDAQQRGARRLGARAARAVGRRGDCRGLDPRSCDLDRRLDERDRFRGGAPYRRRRLDGCPDGGGGRRIRDGHGALAEHDLRPPGRGDERERFERGQRRLAYDAAGRAHRPRGFGGLGQLRRSHLDGRLLGRGGFPDRVPPAGRCRVDRVRHRGHGERDVGYGHRPDRRHRLRVPGGRHARDKRGVRPEQRRLRDHVRHATADRPAGRRNGLDQRQPDLERRVDGRDELHRTAADRRRRLDRGGRAAAESRVRGARRVRGKHGLRSARACRRPGRVHAERPRLAHDAAGAAQEPLCRHRLLDQRDPDLDRRVRRTRRASTSSTRGPTRTPPERRRVFV